MSDIEFDGTRLDGGKMSSEEIAQCRRERREGRQLAKHLVGRTIVGVEMNEFDDGRGMPTYNPIIMLDDGSRVTFSVDELEDGGSYGITPTLHNKPARSKPKRKAL